MSQAGVLNLDNIPPPPGSVTDLKGNDGIVVPPDGSGIINLLGASTIQVTGNAGTNTETISPTASGYPITPYVVGPSSKAGYQTVQAAINAAHTAGGGIVYIQPGVYTENLTLYTGVDLYGTPAVSQNQGSSTTISGQHTPPTSGHVGFNSICFTNTSDIFFSASAGSTHLVFLNCESAVQNGHFLNLTNWTGILEVFDHNSNTAGAPFSINDGGITNSGGSTVLIYSSGFGSGTNTMTLSGPIYCQSNSFGCPINFTTGSSISSDQNIYNSIVTLSNNSTGYFDACHFVTGSSAAFTMSSSGSISLTHSTVNSSNSTCIAGAGAGTLTLDEVIFLNNTSISNSLTLSTTGGFYPPGNLGSSGYILTSNGLGSVPTFQTASASGAITTITGNTGGAESPSTGNFNIIGTGSITVAGSANTETIQLTGLTNHSLLVGAGTATITNLGIATNGQLPIGSAGANPVLATLTAGTGISVTNGAGSITIAATGSQVVWTDEGTSFNAVVGNGYFATASITATLPASPSQGNLISFAVDAAATLTITANTGQVIRIGAAVSATAGTAANNARGDSVTLVFRSSDSAWIATSVLGTWTVT